MANVAKTVKVIEECSAEKERGGGINWKERKAKKRKWREEKLIKELEKNKEKEEKIETERVERSLSVSNGRGYTVSVALPGSILDNAQSIQLRAYLAGQIARASVVFNIDEIIIFDETGNGTTSVEADVEINKGRCNVQMARILQYLECPQYLRKHFFPIHRDLEFAGVCNPLDCMHHAKVTDNPAYREGVVIDKPAKKGLGCVVNVGLQKDVHVQQNIQAGMRVTVKMADQNQGKKLKGCVVSPTAPRTEAGLYWGYSVRLAASLSAVFTQCPHAGGYDLSIGTSEKGDSVDDFHCPTFKHAVIVLGGVQGLEASLDADDNLHMEDPSLLFNHYLNTCPNQGSNTIRTEEAILISLSALRPTITEAFANGTT